MRQIHGIADAKKVMMVGETDDTEIRIVDGHNRILLSVPCHLSSLTTEQARYIAKQLIDAAVRVERAAGDSKS